MLRVIPATIYRAIRKDAFPAVRIHQLCIQLLERARLELGKAGQ